MSHNDKKTNKSSLAPIVIPAIIGAITTIVAAYFSYSAGVNTIQIPISATQTAEAKQASIPSNPTAIIQLAEESPTSTLISTEIFFDDFTSIRNDGLGLPLITKEKLVTNISGGHYVAEVDSGFIETVPIITENTIRNFDFVVKIAEIQGEIFLSLRFREKLGISESRIDIFVNGERKGEYLFYETKKEIIRGNATYVDLKEIRVLCINDTCDLFLNGAANPTKTFYQVFDPSGQFRIGFAATGTIRIDEIKIEELP